MQADKVRVEGFWFRKLAQVWICNCSQTLITCLDWGHEICKDSFTMEG
jgi:hypothetical protein